MSHQSAVYISKIVQIVKVCPLTYSKSTRMETKRKRYSIGFE